MTFDLDTIRRTNPLSATIGGRIALTRNGGEWLGLCPFHQEKTPSFTVNEAKGFYHCFGCGAHGDVISFIADYHSLDFRAACRLLGGESEDSAATPHQSQGREPVATTPDPYADLTAADSGTREIAAGQAVRCWNPKRPDRPWVTYRPSLVFPYRDKDGGLIGYVLRIDLADGRKITPQIRHARLPDGTHAWTHWAFDRPRALYNLPELAAHPGHQVLVVEGEKAAEAARRLFAGLPLAVTCWPGGGKAARHADWSVLQGRSVVLWGDADQPGEEAMLGWHDRQELWHDGVAQLCHMAGAKTIRFIPWDHDKPAGWDAADAECGGMMADELLAWLSARVRNWQAPMPAPATTMPQEEAAPYAADAEIPLPPYDGPEIPLHEHASDRSADAPPFRILGFNKGLYYYYPRASQQVVALSAAAHSKAHLLTLAPLAYWAQHHPGRNGFDLDAAADALINAAHRVGLFTADRLRGRGAWRDNYEDGRARIVVHTGPVAYIDGRAYDPAVVTGEYVYEASPALTLKPSEPAGTAEANRLVQICKRLCWENSLSGDLLAGWCVIALICGVLAWRPHIWITGPAQAGKSTVLKDIIGRVVGFFALYMDGKTTEAGIRQLLGSDARPVILDEAESEDQAAAQRMQQILDLARVSSSGGTVVKGSTAGKPITYTLRACFCFSSINTAVSHYADETRISKLVLRKNDAPEADKHYRQLTDDIDSWFTPDYAAPMLARSIAHIEVLLKNAETFKTAAARILHSRRAADQIGTMLAGLYLCYSTKAISVEDAEAWIKERDWHDHTALGAVGDETRLLERLATRRLRVPTAAGIREVTVGQAIMAVHGNPDSYGDWAAELGANGFRLDGDHVLIANNASPLKKLLEGTPWAADWLRPLRMLPGAEAAPNTYFSPGLRSRATRLPVKLLGMENESEAVKGADPASASRSAISA
ncbi:CHC2 zinc finger domain-containing protein [Dongia soli]|uniref:CHC2 zinc finger domain-containing protein n=1 Tax=Dongia soli TaxID=600628 RepID=A0ABU5EE91_9PROT|nr:CHC2 zinc finger domain-containing protein [Dongia soli]MDY0884531.1 CHC2 zinc finger domain-containing protein [Dongia soli]